jgi:hypothetical protein
VVSDQGPAAILGRHGSELVRGRVLLALADGGRRHGRRQQGLPRLQARQQEPPRQAEGACACAVCPSHRIHLLPLPPSLPCVPYNFV